MQIVIDIPEDDYHDILQYTELKANTEFENLMIVAIKNGTPLPRNHGRIIDADALIKDYNKYVGYTDIIYDLTKAQTIVEADNDNPTQKLKDADIPTV